MLIDAVLLPPLLEPRHVVNRAVVVLDVLRATTTVAAALAAGAREIQVFPSVDDVRGAVPTVRDGLLLCGEERCLRPDTFDLGNSPGEFTRDRVAGKTILMSTTNGTRAIVAARGAARLYAAALVNAEATARHLAQVGMDVTLLCAGTGGEVALEDVVGAGAIVAALNRLTQNKLMSDASRIASALFEMSEKALAQTLRNTQGGRNVMNAGLDADIDFAARLNALDVVARVDPRTLTVTRVDPV